MRNIKILLIIVLLGATAQTAAAAGPGTTGADILKVNLGARPVALGGAFGSVGGDAQVLLFNPAALATLKSSNIIFQRYVAFEQVTYELLGGSCPLPGVGRLGGILVWRHMPAIDNPGAPDNPVAANDLVLTMGLSRSLGELLPGGWASTLSGLSFGVGGKIIYLMLRENTAFSVAGDAGLYWNSQKLLPVTIAAAAALQNLGLPVRFIEEEDPLPLQGRLAMAVLLNGSKRHSGRLTAEMVMPADNPVKTSLGMEYIFARILSFRLGYTWEAQENLQGPAGGLGLAFVMGAVQARIDYAYKPILWRGWESVANNHLVSVDVSF